MTGLETCEVLCDKGNKVIVVEMADALAPGTWFQLVDDAMERLQGKKAKFMTGTKLLSVDEEGVLLEKVRSGKQKKIKANVVVNALGVSPVDGLYKELSEFGLVNVYKVGDVDTSGTIAHACHDAYDTVMRL